MNKEENVHNYPNSIDTRVALLEMSIMNINETLKEIKSEIKDIRLDAKEMRIEMKNGFSDITKELKLDFRWLLAIIVGLGGIMAHGFHWL